MLLHGLALAPVLYTADRSTCRGVDAFYDLFCLNAVLTYGKGVVKFVVEAVAHHLLVTKSMYCCPHLR